MKEIDIERERVPSVNTAFVLVALVHMLKVSHFLWERCVVAIHALLQFLFFNSGDEGGEITRERCVSIEHGSAFIRKGAKERAERESFWRR